MKPKTHEKSQTARENSSEKSGADERDTAGETGRQTHENRVNPEKDHVPGHMGYSRENIDTVNPNRDEP